MIDKKTTICLIIPVGVDIIVWIVVSVDCGEVAKTEGFQDLIELHTVF